MWTRVAVGGSNARLRLVTLPRSSVRHSGFGVGGFVQPFIPTEALVKDVLPPRPPGLCLYSSCCRAHLCSASSLTQVLWFWLGTVFGKSRSDQEGKFKCTKQNMWREPS